MPEVDMDKLADEIGKLQENDGYEGSDSGEETDDVEIDAPEQEVDDDAEDSSASDDLESAEETEEVVEEKASDLDEADFPEAAKQKIETLEKALAKAKSEKNRLLERTKNADKPGEAEKWKNIAVKAALTDALGKASYDTSEAKKVDRALRLLDLEKITVDESGNFVGVQEQVKLFQEEYPEFFTGATNPKDSPLRRTPPKKVDTSTSEVDKSISFEQEFADYYGFGN